MKFEIHVSMTAAEVLDLIGARRTSQTHHINGESKTAMIRTMLLRPAGVTSKEAESASGWKSVNLPGHARKAGIEIYKRERENGHMRYFGRRIEG
jgi:hypothetical protein